MRTSAVRPLAFLLALMLAATLAGTTGARAQDDGTPTADDAAATATAEPESEATEAADDDDPAATEEASSQSEATGEASQSSGGGANEETAATGGQDVAPGQPIQFLDEDGDEIAVITVTNVTDGFEEFDEFFTPEDDVSYIAVDIEVQSTGDELEVGEFDFGLHTADGFFYGTEFVSLPDDTEVVEIETTEVEEGESLAGTLFFAVPEEAELSRLLWQPENGRILVIASFGNEVAA